MGSSGAYVRITRASKHFASNGSTRSVLRGIDLALQRGEFTTLLGPNGCGKSTLLNMIAGLIVPDSGTVEICSASGVDPEVGYVWQDYRASLLPWLSVLENAAFPLRLRGMSRSKRRDIVEPILSRFLPGVDPHCSCHELSGGEQQMICIVRSSTIRPDVLLLDEPFSALDQRRSWQMALHVEQLWLDQKPAVLFVSHDIDEAILLADRVLLMDKSGRIVSQLCNGLRRPRELGMLNSREHLSCRAQVVDFFQSLDANDLGLDEKEEKEEKEGQCAHRSVARVPERGGQS